MITAHCFRFILRIRIMKKVFYSIAIISATMFAACGEKGTSYETADANQDENVNRSHIRSHGQGQTAAGLTEGSDATWRQNAEQISSKMASDLKLDPDAQNRVQQVLYERERRLSELQYNLNETNRMGGQVAEDVDNIPTRDRDRYDRDGGTMTDTRTNMSGNMETNTTAATEMDVQREQIMTETDRELQSILTPQQYRQYQEKRANYWGMSTENPDPEENTGPLQNSGQNQQNNGNQRNNSGNNNNQPGADMNNN